MSLATILIQQYQNHGRYHKKKQKSIDCDFHEVRSEDVNKVISRKVKIRLTNDELRNERAFFVRIASVDSHIANEIRKSGCKDVGCHLTHESLVNSHYINGEIHEYALLPKSGIPVNIVSRQTAINKHKGKPIKLRFWLEFEIMANLSLK